MGTPDYDELRHTVEAQDDKICDLIEAIDRARTQLKSGDTREADHTLRDVRLRWL